MNTTIIILLCVALCMAAALGGFVLLRSKRRHARRCGARETEQMIMGGPPLETWLVGVGEPDMKRKWRAAVLDWRRRMEPRPGLFETGLAERHFRDLPEPDRSIAVDMNSVADMEALCAASQGRVEGRNAWRWLRERGLLSLGFQAIHEMRGEER